MATKKKAAKSSKSATGTSKAAMVQKLIKKGMSPKQANAFATQAVKRSKGK